MAGIGTAAVAAICEIIMRGERSGTGKATRPEKTEKETEEVADNDFSLHPIGVIHSESF